jgi:hypothetical protein
MVVWDLVQVTGFFLVLHDECIYGIVGGGGPELGMDLASIHVCVLGNFQKDVSQAVRRRPSESPVLARFRPGSLGDTADRPVHSINETHSSICSKQRIPVNAILYVPGAGIASQCPAPPGVRYGEILIWSASLNGRALALRSSQPTSRPL